MGLTDHEANAVLLDDCAWTRRTFANFACSWVDHFISLLPAKFKPIQSKVSQAIAESGIACAGEFFERFEDISLPTGVKIHIRGMSAQERTSIEYLDPRFDNEPRLVQNDVQLGTIPTQPSPDAHIEGDTTQGVQQEGTCAKRRCVLYPQPLLPQVPLYTFNGISRPRPPIMTGDGTKQVSSIPPFPGQHAVCTQHALDLLPSTFPPTRM